MPRPRKSLINLSDTPYYHCVSRCVRRAYLCGKDNQTGKSYEHRRQWVEDRLLFLAEVFCVVTVMDSHSLDSRPVGFFLNISTMNTRLF